MKHVNGVLIVFKLLYIFTFSISLSSSLNSDGLSLLALKAAITTDPMQVLTSWTVSDSTPCNWDGITCDRTHHKVTSISLSNKGLTGYIPSELGALSSLTSLSLSFNNFSKAIPPHLFNATSLSFLELSHNSLSGPLPHQITSLKNLIHLDLSSNQLNGSLPEALSDLTHLSGTLNLSCNRFSGEIPTSFGQFPVILSLDLRENNLTGKIPQAGSLLNQGPTAFTGNPYLCGFPLNIPCGTEPEAENPRIQRNPEKPELSSDGTVERQKTKSGPRTISLISGVSVLIAVVFVSVWVMRKRWKLEESKAGTEKVENEVASEEGQKGKFVVVDEGFTLELEDLLRASAYVVGKSRSGIVYKVVAGSGGKSSAVGGPTVVAVRRLSDGDNTWKFKEFEAEVEAIGRVQHLNIVRLRAYYYASDEKLLISDFICNGSLHNALHGMEAPKGNVLGDSRNGYMAAPAASVRILAIITETANKFVKCWEMRVGGPANTLPPLSWAARLRIAQGAARGLMYIHECSPRKYVHGNIKASKILLDDDLRPYLSGFGLTRLVSGSSKPANAAFRRQNSKQLIVSPKSSSSSTIMYLAPEARITGSKFTQKCDVYSFGIVLLEILTGRLPDVGLDNDGKGLESHVRKVFREERPLSEIIDPALLHEVHAKKQVVAAFHIALNCTELDPEFRPRMRMVSESLDSIKLQ